MSVSCKEHIVRRVHCISERDAGGILGLGGLVCALDVYPTRSPAIRGENTFLHIGSLETAQKHTFPVSTFCGTCAAVEAFELAHHVDLSPTIAISERHSDIDAGPPLRQIVRRQHRLPVLNIKPVGVPYHAWLGTVVPHAMEFVGCDQASPVQCAQLCLVIQRKVAS